MASPQISNVPNGTALQLDSYDVLPSRGIRASSKDFLVPPMTSSPSMSARLLRKRSERHHRRHAPSGGFQEAFQTLPPLNTYGPSVSMAESSGTQLPPQASSSPAISHESLQARATEAGMDLDVASQLQGHHFQRLQPIAEEPEHSRSHGCRFVQATLEIPYRGQNVQSVQPTFEIPSQGDDFRNLPPTVEEPAQDQGYIFQARNPIVEDAMPNNMTDAMSLVADSASPESQLSSSASAPPPPAPTTSPNSTPPFSLSSPLVLRHPRRQHANTPTTSSTPTTPTPSLHLTTLLPFYPLPPSSSPPYPSCPPYHPYYIPQLPTRVHRTLIDSIVSIAQRLWERALELEVQAVQRMGRLCACAEEGCRCGEGGEGW